jgi:hypothetical protein
MNGQVVVMVSLDLNQDVQVARRMGGVRAGGFRIWKTVVRIAVVGQEYLVGHIWMSH